MRSRRRCAAALLAIASACTVAQTGELSRASRSDTLSRWDTSVSPQPASFGVGESIVPNQFIRPDAGPFVPPKLQRSAPTQSSPPLLWSTEGLTFNQSGRVVPPDPVLDVSDTDVLLVANRAIAIYDRITGTRRAGPLSLAALWQNFGGPCEDASEGDPTVVYDDFAQVWVISQMAMAAQRQCVAVSRSSDPLGAYNRYEFAFPHQNDFGKIAVWTDGARQSAYVLTVHAFASGRFLGTDFVALDRDAMRRGDAAPRMWRIFLPDLYGAQPIHLDGPDPAPTRGCGGFVHFLTGPSRYRLWSLCVDWAAPPGATQLRSSDLDSDPFTPLTADAAQPGVTATLDTFGAATQYRVAARAFGRDGPAPVALALSHSIDAGAGQGALRWAQIGLHNEALFQDAFGDNTAAAGAPLQPSLIDAGNYAPDEHSRFLGAAVIDRSGNLGVGTHAASSTLVPSVRVGGRAREDEPSALRAEQACSVGGGVQTGSHGRFGDYTSVALGTDQCTFYYAGQYFPTSSDSDWSTRLCAWRYPACGQPAFAFAGALRQNLSVCGTAQPALRLDIQLGALDGYVGTAALSLSGWPGPAQFVESTLAVPGRTQLLLEDLHTVSSGSYALRLRAQDGTVQAQRAVDLQLWRAVSAVPNAALPVPNQIDVSPRPVLRATPTVDTRTLRFEVARDAAFNQVVADSTQVDSRWQPASPLPTGEHYWRVRAENQCGVSAYSTGQRFTVRDAEACPNGQRAQRLYSQDFESIDLPIAVSGTGVEVFRRLAAPPGTGLSTMVFGLANDPNFSEQRATFATISIPADISRAFLAFDSYHLFESNVSLCRDAGWLNLSVDGGPFLPVSPDLVERDVLRDTLRIDGQSVPAWCQIGEGRTVVELSAYAGRSVQLQLQVRTDVTGVAPAPNGWYIDNLSVNQCVVPDKG